MVLIEYKDFEQHTFVDQKPLQYCNSPAGKDEFFSLGFNRWCQTFCFLHQFHIHLRRSPHPQFLSTWPPLPHNLHFLLTMLWKSFHSCFKKLKVSMEPRVILWTWHSATSHEITHNFVFKVWPKCLQLCLFSAWNDLSLNLWSFQR